MYFLNKVDQTDELGCLDKIECSGTNKLCRSSKQQEQYAAAKKSD
jgi:hypothetical protein